ncbi:MAG TPA: BatD family protein [Chthoniobacterales bacterium]|nr:BatD family protein [Chthoniobacterales bacterium]
MPRSFFHCLPARLAVASLALAACISSAQAEQPSVTAVLSSSQTAVGQPVELQIQVRGDRNVSPPTLVPVDGLEIRSAGRMQSFEVHNLSVTPSVTFNYTILPLRAGTFKIPAQTIHAGGASLRTEELTLEVGASSNRPQTSADRSAVNPRDIGSAEIIVPKKNVYVGELVPVEIRLRIDARVRFDTGPVAAGPRLDGQGFTIQKLQRPIERQETINGRRFFVFIYKTAIAAAKAGSLTIGPAELETLMQWPRTRPRQYSPRDIFEMDDAFSGILPNPFADLTQPVAIKISGEAVTLEVKTLPPNPPASFSGAVGNFTMESDANPKVGQVGDPFTVTTKISGRGNFDRVTAPALEDEAGWRKYPPSANFKQDDDVGISGIKTFESVLTPNERKDKIPAQLFTYFDSLKEQYVTLRTDPIPVRVEGTAAPAATAPVSASQAAAPDAAPSAVPKQQDILHQLTNLPAAPQSFTPFFARRSFWLAQLVPLLALLGYIGWKLRQAHLDNRDARRREALQQEATELERSLGRDDASPQEYFSRASRAVQLKTALAKNLDPNTVDAEVAASAFQTDENTRLRLRHLFEKSDEARYSGAGPNGNHRVSSETRTEVLDLIGSLRK